MTMEKTLKMRANDNFMKLGRHNLRILHVIRAQVAAGSDMSVVMDTLDRYYEVANPHVYEALQSDPALRAENAAYVLAHGIDLHHTFATGAEVNVDLVLQRVCEITSEVGA